MRLGRMLLCLPSKGEKNGKYKESCFDHTRKG